MSQEERHEEPEEQEVSAREFQVPPAALLDEDLIVYATDQEDSQALYSSYRQLSQISAMESHYSSGRKRRALAEAERQRQAQGAGGAGGGQEFVSPGYKRRRAEEGEGEEEGRDEATKPPPPEAPVRPCVCGAGPCSVFTSSTEKNPGRRFYRCPLGKDGGCGFFEWVDVFEARAKGGGGAGGSPAQAGAPPRPPGVPSPAGPSPAAQPNPALAERIANSTCFHCKGTGHWASNCPNRAAPGGGGAFKGPGQGFRNSGGGNVGGARPGACYRCGQEGHWSSNCPNKGGRGPGR